MAEYQRLFLKIKIRVSKDVAELKINSERQMFCFCFLHSFKGRMSNASKAECQRLKRQNVKDLVKGQNVKGLKRKNVKCLKGRMSNALKAECQRLKRQNVKDLKTECQKA